MLKIMSEEDECPTVITLSRGDIFYTWHAIPNDAERYARVDYLVGEEIRLIIKKNCIAVVEGLWTPYMGASIVSFMREDRFVEGVYGLGFAKPIEVPNLREALNYLDIPKVHIVTGVTDAVIYHDEVMISDYDGRGGSYGWIVKQEDISRYIAVLPEVRDSGKLDKIYIYREMHEGVDGKLRALIRIEGWSKYPDPEKDNQSLYTADEYKILFDTGSRVIKRIRLSNAYGENIPCDKGPLRNIIIGKRLPYNLGRTKWGVISGDDEKRR